VSRKNAPDAADVEDTGPVGSEVAGLVHHPPVGPDGEQLWVKQPVEFVDVAGEHGGLQSTLLAKHRLLVRMAGAAHHTPAYPRLSPPADRRLKTYRRCRAACMLAPTIR
jgi:hypothetical protein